MQELQTETRLGALEGAMAAAVRDYKAELTATENKEKGDQRAVNEQEIDLLEDDEIDIIHKQRLVEMKREAQRREEESKKAGHGSYNLVEESKFLDEVPLSLSALKPKPWTIDPKPEPSTRVRSPQPTHPHPRSRSPQPPRCTAKQPHVPRMGTWPSEGVGPVRRTPSHRSVLPHTHSPRSMLRWKHQPAFPLR